MRLGFLNSLFERPGPWATVYVDTSHPDQSSAEDHERSAREACRRLEQQGADARTCRAVYDELATVTPATEPVGRAVFASRGEVVLDPSLTVPPQSAPKACWSALPHVGPLVELAGDDPSCLVAYISRTGADFELRGAHGDRAVGQAHRTATADWPERRFQLRTENTWEHNAGLIADELRARQEETRADLVLLVGDARERRAVHERLPEQLRGRAAETAHGGRAAGSASPGTHAARLLDRDVDEVRARHVHGHTEEAMERFRAGRVPMEGRVTAAEGVPGLVDAAREHRIGTLLIRPDGTDLYRDVWAGAEPDQVAMRRSDLQYLGDARPVAVRADDALIRSAAATGAEVLTVPPGGGADDTNGAPVGGPGALLRWPYEGAAQ